MRLVMTAVSPVESRYETGRSESFKQRTRSRQAAQAARTEGHAWRTHALIDGDGYWDGKTATPWVRAGVFGFEDCAHTGRGRVGVFRSLQKVARASLQAPRE